ncbi:hypothetical protein ACFLZ2_04715 [Candidatus Margulisiibacteriota bacterium]
MGGVPAASRPFKPAIPGRPLVMAVNVTAYRDQCEIVKEGATAVIDKTWEMCNHLEIINLQVDKLENSYAGLNAKNVFSSNGYMYSRKFLEQYRQYFDDVDSFIPMGVAVGRDFDTVVQSILAIKLTGLIGDLSMLFPEEDGFSLWPTIEMGAVRALHLRNGPEINLNFIADAVSPHYQDMSYGIDGQLLFTPYEMPPELRVPRVASWSQLQIENPGYKEDIQKIMFESLKHHHARMFALSGLNIFQYEGHSVFMEKVSESEEEGPIINLIYWRSSEEFLEHTISQYLAA